MSQEKVIRAAAVFSADFEDLKLSEFLNVSTEKAFLFVKYAFNIAIWADNLKGLSVFNPCLMSPNQGRRYRRQRMFVALVRPRRRQFRPSVRSR